MSDEDKRVDPEVNEPNPIAPTEETKEPILEIPLPSLPPTPTLDELLEKASPDEIRKHPRFAGILGSELDNRLKAIQIAQDRESKEQRREETEAELFRFFEANADYVQEHYPKAYERFTDMQTERAQREIEGLRGKTSKEFASSIGKAISSIPEWKELTPEDHELLIKEVAGKSDEEVLPIFNQKALDLIADKRAAALFSKWKEKELKTDREAIRQEEAVKLLAKGSAPDGTPPKNGPSNLSIPSMSDADFDKLWNEKFRR